MAAAAACVLAAVDLDGSHITAPLDMDDPSPIADIHTYHPDQHDCPLPCADTANVHSWITYFSISRLRRCDEPLLLQLSISQALDDPQSTTLIRACSLAHLNEQRKSRALLQQNTLMENPKKMSMNAQDAAEPKQLACATNGTVTLGTASLQAFRSETQRASNKTSFADTDTMLQGIAAFFANPDNCDERFVFGYRSGTAAAAFIGTGLGKRTMTALLASLRSALDSDRDLPSERVVAQLCGPADRTDQMAGVVIDASGDLAAVQRTILGWRNGECSEEMPRAAGTLLLPTRVFRIGATNATLTAGGPYNNNITSRAATTAARLAARLWRRETCRYERVRDPDSCSAIAERCGVSLEDVQKHNPDARFCNDLQPGGYALAAVNGITVADIERWNKGKTWAWTECKDMLQGYSMCLSEGTAPMPPPQEGTQCGPLVPGTKKPSKDVSLADLNPCPLKACCSNWGFCGVFPAHCAVHAPPGGGPGSKEKGFQNTCVSNCGNEIKKGSGPPAAFGRIGYYESYGMDRACLTLKAHHANTDGSYTHIHWAFANIDPKTWKPVIDDKKGQWSGFKKLQGVKRIVSFGGWALSTEPQSYNIIRQAILDNRETFADNLAKFAEDEGLDGIDIDWEYPGAPDILVDGKPIGQKGDGVGYLKFLMALKGKLGSKSVSIAAPASYWYLQAFPIDRIAKVIDYIVYMTYDLHGQWDYGNPNAYDMCESGKCIRSHATVNLTETRNALSMITKAGVPNNKIFVGEASYGRSFHMAQDGCWGPMCDFTGTRQSSDAAPGRCTNTSGYVSYAELAEIIRRDGGNARTFHDGDSNSDVLLYRGDYISYMTPTTKNTRREDWRGLNFAGSIDWAVDLQAFTSDDFENVPEPPRDGQGCNRGDDLTVNSGSLCQFTCQAGFCPATLCECLDTGRVKALPEPDTSVNARAVDEFDADLNRLCYFACRYGVCPGSVCVKTPHDGSNTDRDAVDPGEPTGYFDYDDARRQNANKCYVYKDTRYHQDSVNQCYNACWQQIKEAKEAGENVNYGCVGFFPLDKPIPWSRALGPSSPLSVSGSCSCNNPLVNFFAETIFDALAAIAQSILDIGLELFPAGRVLSVALDAITSAVKLIKYVYDEGEDPEGAWQWWLSPCGGTDLVPDDLKKAFEIVGQRLGEAKNTLRIESCDAQHTTHTTDYVVTTLTYAAQATALAVKEECPKRYSQACFHYSSANRANAHWATLTCPQKSAATAAPRDGRSPAVRKWYRDHAPSWRGQNPGASCQADEWPPYYFLQKTDDEFRLGGKDPRGQRIRYVPGDDNGGAGNVWRSVCFRGALAALTDAELKNKVNKANTVAVPNTKPRHDTLHAAIDVDKRPQFSFSWGHAGSPPADDGLFDNACWPDKLTKNDPGFALLVLDEWYAGNPKGGKTGPRWDYSKPYAQGSNGD
uniref:chitinase n=1 Tax=Cordyceps cicadae TaxID=218633 RepID=A0A514TPA2_9HYPO|nr:chitinase chiC1 [Cordyceps cicadae]